MTVARCGRGFSTERGGSNGTICTGTRRIGDACHGCRDHGESRRVWRPGGVRVVRTATATTATMATALTMNTEVAALS
jgi:hypothetical protein